MATPTPTPAPAPTKWNAVVLTAIFLIVGAILFYLVYLAFPSDQHFYGLVWIGILALIFAAVCYLAESFSRDPAAQRSLAWGFFGMGFAVLFLTIGLAPTYGISLGVWQYVGLLLTAIALGVAIALIGWRMRAVQTTARREVVREEWRERPAPSAFTYAAANSPSVPATAPPPASSPSNPAPPPRSP